MKDFLKSLVRLPLVTVLRALFLFPVLPILYAVEPFRKIRFGLISTQRIGHLAANTELFLRQRQTYGTDPKAVYVFAGWDPANRQLFAMYKRLLSIYESRWLTRILFAWRPLLKLTQFYEPLKWRWDVDHFHVFNQGRATLTFTEEEEAKGRDILASMGIGDDDWFVCFHARDSAYLNHWRPQYSHLWKTRDFRNNDIDKMLNAAEFITSRGGFAIRMGAMVEKPLENPGNPRIIDYATRFRSDFMDVYLCAKARFFLGSNSGLFMVATAFDVPVAMANLVPLGAGPLHSGDIFIPKLLRDIRTGELLTFQEAYDRDFYNLSRMLKTELHEEQGYEWVENDSDDIVGLVKNMLGIIEGEELDHEAAQLRQTYRQRFMNHIPYNEQAGRMSPAFALKYRNLIEAGA